jgi:hypothetical protein
VWEQLAFPQRFRKQHFPIGGSGKTTECGGWLSGGLKKPQNCAQFG